jgi:hypothetical protein
MRAAIALAGAVAATALASCGAGVRAADLFLVTRTGSTPHAGLTLLVDEEGGVQCNGGVVHHIDDPHIVQARAIQEELHSDATSDVSLPARPGSVLRYAVREEGGTVSFSDNSAGAPRAAHSLEQLVLYIAQEVCGLPE